MDFFRKIGIIGDAFLQYIYPELCRPKSGRIIVTQNCPLRCKMCTFWHRQHSDPDLKLIKYWIQQLADFGVKDIDIGGGEPFTREDLTDIVKEIKSYGITCGLTTSGWLVDKVPFPPIDRCEISIDGATPETHDKIRGIEGSWEQAIHAVKVAKKYCKVTQLNFVLQPDNYHELIDFCKLTRELEVPQIGLIPVSLKLAAQSPISKSLNDFDLPLLKKIIAEALKIGNIANNKEFIRIFLSKLENGFSPQKCLAAFNCILIFTNGDVYPCGNFDVAVGKFCEGKSLKNIYDEYKMWRRKILQGQHERCASCIYSDITTRGTILSSTVLFLQRNLKRKGSKQPYS